MIDPKAERANSTSRSRIAAWLAWSMWVLSLALTSVGLAFLFASRSAPFPSSAWGFRGFTSIFAGTFSTVGWLIARRHAQNPIGWLFGVIGVLFGLQLVGQEYAVYAILALPGSLPAGEFMAWLQNWIWIPGFLPICYIFLLFPNGRLLSQRWRIVAWLIAPSVAIGIVVVALAPGRLGNFPVIDNPFAVSGFPEETEVFFLWAMPFLGLFVASAISLMLRFREATGEERQQLKWLAYAAAFLPLSLVPASFIPAAGFAVIAEVGQGLAIAAAASIPVAIGVAILKYRLYEIDLIINRTLVYGSLTLLLAGVYFASVAVLQAGFRAITGQDSPLAVVLSTLALAALFSPLRGRIQSAIDRRFYRSKYDASRILSAFGANVRDEVEVSKLSASLMEAAVQAMQPTTLSLWLRDSGEPLGRESRIRSSHP